MDNDLKRAREILDAEAAAIRNIPLDSDFAEAVSELLRCPGKVITTGMGKAGKIAQKMAGTLCSTGTPACYLHPGEAAHGDLGVMSEGDAILAYSTSGKTREVLEMLELARHLGVTSMIGITSHPDSSIRELCPVVLNMGEITEPCSLGLTPTSSTIVMLAISDALALVLMERKNITQKEFGLRHHGGYLGTKAKNACS
ncbi:MAG: SIS domain-containing protein [Chitinivibrionales bacterium]|nr:SIS domain-containing protein [Chitinivibrionales bacterium]